MEASIVALAREHFSATANVWLFGSRVIDDAKGGDIDLLIEDVVIDDPVLKKSAFRIDFEKRWGEQKLDIILLEKSQSLLPIHEIAKTEGILLGKSGAR